MSVKHASVVLVTVGGWLILGVAAIAAQPSSDEASQAAAATQTGSRQMARRIDELIEQQWSAGKLKPAAPATDSEFLRRASLDLTGAIPRVSKVREYLADTSANKREVLIDELLASPPYATHMATTWRNRILPTGVEPARNRQAIALQKWLRTRFAKNLRYDNLVGELLLTIGGEELGPALYFQVHDLQPEKLASSAAELFLGLQLHCAQCHDHPFADWTQQDFWGLAAFFARVQTRGDRRMGMDNLYELVDARRGDVRLPDTDQIVPPKYPRGDVATEDARRSRRVQLALWMTSRDNRFFSRAAVNWAWSHLFGRGLVESLDHLDDSTPAGHLQLLDELADYFVDSGFDLNELWQTLANTRAYQLSSRHAEPSSSQSHRFAWMLPKPLTPEQLYDIFVLLAPGTLATGRERNGLQSTATAGGLDEDPMRMDFVRRMRTPPGNATEYRSGTLQVLMLMNGRVASGVSGHDSRLLGAIQTPVMTDEDRIEALFLAALSRPPDAEERTMCIQLLADCDSARARNQVLSDILWALLNSTEFAFNH